jgi:hypothetical protein
VQSTYRPDALSLLRPTETACILLLPLCAQTPAPFGDIFQQQAWRVVTLFSPCGRWLRLALCLHSAGKAALCHGWSGS